MSIGWVSLHRSIKDHWIFERDDYFKAWITMLMEVNHKENKTLIKGKLLTCPRGESLLSHQSWADKFGKGWNRAKVMRFFKTLESDQMIVQVNEQVTTRLSVCNYSKFQDRKESSGQANGQQALQQADSKRTGDGTQPNNVNKGISKESTKTRSKFKKPTVDEIKKAVKEKGYSVNPVNFFTFYESKDWMIGKNKMKSWEHALANWQSREKPTSKKGVQW